MLLEKEKISVALCTYNGEHYIIEQLVSILSQTVLPSQIVISDDGSSDNTVNLILETLKRYGSTNSEIQKIQINLLVNKEPLGISRNFEQALKNCNSPLIALCDQDDIWALTKLEIMSAEFDKFSDLKLLHSDAELVDSAGNSKRITAFQALRISKSENRKVSSGKAIDVLLRRNIVTGAATMFHRSLLDSALPFPKSWLHDEWLAITAACIGRIIKLDVCLIKYRQHGGNQVGLSKLGFKHLLGKILHPRKLRNIQLLTRAQELASHELLNHIDQAIQFKIQNKLLHEQVRSSYSTKRIARIVPICKEILTGRYSTYGMGIQDVIRDACQPE